ncbi:MAG TPA: hypothetical protein VHX65_15985 [Pirellulales bacterium]|jgi:hypothetical protein|nr:hypothetical protein [Pirellulales bacterium]
MRSFAKALNASAGSGRLLLSLACLLGAGCVSSSQQQPKQTAANTIDSRSNSGSAATASAAASTPDSDAGAQPAAITSRGAAIEHDLDGKFSRSGAGDP